MKRIGIIGGGQLGKMMILAAKYTGYEFVILDPTPDCPAHSIADMHIVADFHDEEAIMRLASKVDVVTYEFEHINAEALERVENNGTPVHPSSKTLKLIQNKLEQKKYLQNHEIPVPEFMGVESYEKLTKVGTQYGYPFLLKTCTGGYDGKGNFVVHSEEECTAGYQALGGGALPLMAEKFVDFEKEVSVLACGNAQGEISVFPVAENLHKDNILDETVVPARILENTTKEAMDVARKCVEVFEASGMFCVELFVLKDGHVCVNELAPRPHNSGHYTIEGCVTSQYEQHIRAICGLPLGNPSLLRPTVMKNLIGDHEGPANVTGIEEAYKNPNVKIHIYGKSYVKPGRKMGHITATCETVEEALKEVRDAYEKIRI